MTLQIAGIGRVEEGQLAFDRIGIGIPTGKRFDTLTIHFQFTVFQEKLTQLPWFQFRFQTGFFQFVHDPLGGSDIAFTPGPMFLRIQNISERFYISWSRLGDRKPVDSELRPELIPKV